MPSNVTCVMLQILWLMHQLTQGVSAGGSLALALKLLSWADNPVLPPPALCEHLSGGDWRWESTSFSAGLICGLVLYAGIEFLITLRWAIVQWISSKGQVSATFDPKPRFKILARVLRRCEDSKRRSQTGGHIEELRAELANCTG